MSRNNSLGLGDPAFESRHEKDVFLFPKPFRSFLVLTPSYLEVTGLSFPKGTAAGA